MVGPLGLNATTIFAVRKLKAYQHLYIFQRRCLGLEHTDSRCLAHQTACCMPMMSYAWEPYGVLFYLACKIILFGKRDNFKCV